MNKETLENSKIAAHLAPWDANENIIWLASTLSMHRNVEKFKFPAKMEAEKRKHILSLASTTLQNSELPGAFTIKAEEITPLEKNFLLEHFLIFEGFQEAHQGEAFIIDDSGCFIALLNLKDHLQLQLTDIAGDLEKTWARLVQIENKLASSFSFAFSQKFGFLTSDPLLAGTGLVATAYLHLPALIHLKKLSDLTEKEKNEAVLFTGLQGNPEDLVGDILAVRNCYTLGVNEETIISTLRSAILKLLVAEKSARSQIKTENITAIKDKISRALGILKFSFQLDTVEALSAISMLKFGIELGWVRGMTVQEVNKIFFTCRRAHLNYCMKEKIPIEQVAAKRADFLREKVKSLELLVQ